LFFKNGSQFLIILTTPKLKGAYPALRGCARSYPPDCLSVRLLLKILQTRCLCTGVIHGIRPINLVIAFTNFFPLQVGVGDYFSAAAIGNVVTSLTRLMQFLRRQKDRNQIRKPFKDEIQPVPRLPRCNFRQFPDDLDSAAIIHCLRRGAGEAVVTVRGPHSKGLPSFVPRMK
jgi:hypothetical protein